MSEIKELSKKELTPYGARRIMENLQKSYLASDLQVETKHQFRSSVLSFKKLLAGEPWESANQTELLDSNSEHEYTVTQSKEARVPLRCHPVASRLYALSPSIPPARPALTEASDNRLTFPLNTSDINW